MRIYSIGALLKVVIGLTILRLLYHYVNIYQEPVIGLSFGFLGLFMTIWGSSYYFFLAGYKIFAANLAHHLQTSLSYKLSLLFGLFVMINITLMIIDKWSNWLAFGLIFIFILIQVVISNAPNRYTS